VGDYVLILLQPHTVLSSRHGLKSINRIVLRLSDLLKCTWILRKENLHLSDASPPVLGRLLLAGSVAPSKRQETEFGEEAAWEALETQKKVVWQH
jgi:hypothetical protein